MNECQNVTTVRSAAGIAISLYVNVLPDRLTEEVRQKLPFNLLAADGIIKREKSKELTEASLE